jgi:quercetin dioxygenase-like cupin family protein
VRIRFGMTARWWIIPVAILAALMGATAANQKAGGFLGGESPLTAAKAANETRSLLAWGTLDARSAGLRRSSSLARPSVYLSAISTASRLRSSGSQEITRVGSQPSAKGPVDWFTGTVRIGPLFQAKAPTRAAGASVTFEPWARTAWHTHPLGQTLISTAGYGWVQQEGGPVEEVRPGDVVWSPPGVRHWHGATTTTAMTHIAIREQFDGKVVDWLEHVSDEQYRAQGR